VKGRLRLLVVEDSEDDARLLALEIRRGGYEVEYRRVETAEAMRTALATEPWDAVLCDCVLPQFGALAAIGVACEGGRDLPFIVVSGTVKEETAVEVLKAGAHDFVVKDRLARLIPAIARELKEADVRRERRKALDDLKLAVKARDEFLSIASHEIKTPLTALDLQVASALRLVRGGSVDGQRLTAKLEKAERQIDRLTGLVNNLLDVTRITSGGLTVEKRTTDLTEIVRERVARARELHAEGATAIIVQAHGPVVGFWDPILLDAVVGNLLSNALKFGADKPVEVTVSAEADVARLIVEDHGIGIDASDQARIFERFERAVPMRHFGGFGIGLWIARLATEAHGGRILVSSTPGTGSTFVIELPQHEARG
jgi:signal transduction histidine kinase